MAEIVLTYLDARMLAEPIRLALWVGEVAFEDERISYDEVQKRRAAGALPFGQVPVLTVNGQTYSQSAALLRWAGKRAGLFKNETHELQSDAIEAALADLRVLYRPLWYKNVLGRHPATGTTDTGILLTEDQLTQVTEALNTDVLPKRFQLLEAAVQGDTTFCKEGLTVCDLSWYCMCLGILDGFYCPAISPSVLEKCPKLLAIASFVHHHPRITLWNDLHHYSTTNLPSPTEK